MLLATVVLLFQIPGAAAAVQSPPPVEVHATVADRPQPIFSVLVPFGLNDAPTNPGPPSFFDKDNVRLLPPNDDDSKTPARSGQLNLVPPDDGSRILASVRIPEHSETLPPLRSTHTDVGRDGHSWLLLAIAQHGAATFDAWTTNRAVSRGYVEENPFLRPVAGSPAIYGVIQIAPALLDYIGWRMRRSESGILRRTWWLPQTLSMSASLYAGSHNLVHTR